MSDTIERPWWDRPDAIAVHRFPPVERRTPVTEVRDLALYLKGAADIGDADLVTTIKAMRAAESFVERWLDRYAGVEEAAMQSEQAKLAEIRGEK